MAAHLSTAPLRKKVVELSDAERVAGLLDGDPHALGEAYRRHASRVVAVANSVLDDPSAAEDVCQDVFLHLSRHPEKFDVTRAALRTYLVVVAHGRALDRRRAEQARARREIQQARVLLVHGEGADARVLASTTAAQIRAAVNSLPAPEADAVRLAFFGETTYREVARILDVAEGTVKSRIRSGLKRLRVTFVEQGLIPVSW